MLFRDWFIGESEEILGLMLGIIVILWKRFVLLMKRGAVVLLVDGPNTLVVPSAPILKKVSTR
jgi:hypothetical protein